MITDQSQTDIFEPRSTDKDIIMVCVDGSESSEKAIDYCIKFLFDKQQDIVLCHVRPSVSYMESMQWKSDDKFQKLQAEHKLASHQLLKKYIEKCTAAGFDCRGVALVGNPKEQLLLQAENLKPKLVVAGSRGLGMVKRMLLGSVSAHLAHHCPVPILIPK